MLDVDAATEKVASSAPPPKSTVLLEIAAAKLNESMSSPPWMEVLDIRLGSAQCVVAKAAFNT